MQQDQPTELPQADLSDPAISNSPVAPAWHTLVLIAAVILLSVQGAHELTGKDLGKVNRLYTYASTAISELLMVGWVYLGLRLRKVPFRSLFGSISGGLRSVVTDLGFALVFWIAALAVLASIGVMWEVVQTVVEHRSLIPASGKAIAPDPSQAQALHTLTALVPTNIYEIIAWVLLCLVAGFAEEIVFRGYFQRQFTAWSRGAMVWGVVFSSAIFGAAHGYQGVRNMVMLSIFGLLFSLLVLLRGNLRVGIFAHSWHDLIAGLLLASLKTHHVL